MLILFHGGALPPLWAIGVSIPLMLASYALIIYGTIFLATNWKKFDTGVKFVVCLVPLVIFAAYSVVGYIAMAPFGLLAGIPALFFFDTRDFWIYTALVFIGCLLHALGLSGIIGFIAKKMGLA